MLMVVEQASGYLLHPPREFGNREIALLAPNRTATMTTEDDGPR